MRADEQVDAPAERLISEIGIVRDVEGRAVPRQGGIAEERGPIKLIDRGPYAETLIKKGLITVADQDQECLRCADDQVLERYWKDLYKYTVRPLACY